MKLAVILLRNEKIRHSTSRLPTPFGRPKTTKYVHIKSTAHCAQYMSPRRNWDSPNPSLAMQRVCPFPQNRGVGGGLTRLRVRGWGSPNSDDWRKSLALCLLCAPNRPLNNKCMVPSLFGDQFAGKEVGLCKYNPSCKKYCKGVRGIFLFSGIEL
jgi:hypothetical protein